MGRGPRRALEGSFNVSRAAAARFREQQSGAFVHMTSTSGLIGNVGQANYSAAKTGHRRLIAVDCAGHDEVRRPFQLRVAVREHAHDRFDPHSPDQAQRLARLNAMMRRPSRRSSRFSPATWRRGSPGRCLRSAPTRCSSSTSRGRSDRFMPTAAGRRSGSRIAPFRHFAVRWCRSRCRATCSIGIRSERWPDVRRRRGA